MVQLYPRSGAYRGKTNPEVCKLISVQIGPNSKSAVARRYRRLPRRARTLVVRYRKAPLMAISSSVRGTALASPFAMVTWLTAPQFIPNGVWRLEFRTVRLKCENQIAGFQRHTRFRLEKRQRREPEQRADNSPKTLESALSANGRNFFDSSQNKNTCGWRRPGGDPTG